MHKKIFFVLCSLFVFLTIPGQVFAKSYTIDGVDIDAVINENGSVNISETRSYSFSGQFENGVWNTQKGNAKISQVKLFEEGKEYVPGNSDILGNYSVLDTGSEIEVKWKYKAVNETRKFTVSYLLENQVNNFSDTAEFYWKFIGTGWNVPTNNVNVLVHIPDTSSGDNIKAWGHGPLNGVVSIPTNKTIEFKVAYLPANTFFEGRMVFPPLTGMKKQNISALSGIIDEENKLAEQTVAKKNIDSQSVKYAFYIIVGFAVLLAIRFLYWLNIWIKYGKDKPLPDVNLSGSLHEPPSDLEPSLVDSLLSSTFKPTTKSITATVLNLCRQKYLSITEENRDSILGIFPRKPELWFELKKGSYSLSEIENGVLKMLYLDEIPKISKTMISEKMRTDTSAKSRWESWKESCEDKLVEEGFLDKESHKMETKISWDILIGILIAVIFGISFKYIPLGIEAKIIMAVGLGTELFIYFVLIGILGMAMDKRTDKGNLETANWLAFKKYLKDYSVTKNSPLDSVIIWEKMIVYGAALGISLKALSQLPINFGDQANNSYLYLAGMHSNGSFNLDNIGSGIGEVGSAYSSVGASGTGSSGGFSGGGGGGGGGSGGGMS